MAYQLNGLTSIVLHVPMPGESNRSSSSLYKLSPKTPIVAVPIPDQSRSIDAGTFTVNLAQIFSDTDNNTLTFSAVSNRTEIATVSVNGSELMVNPAALGQCRIRVTAKDEGNGKADDTFTLTIRSNQPPALAPQATLGNQVFFVGSEPISLNLQSIFQDPDGDMLLFTAESSNETVVLPSIAQDMLTLTPNQQGQSLITLSADDQHGGTLFESFFVDVIGAYPASINAGVFVAFDDYKDQGNYRMVALPGNQTVPIDNTVKGLYGKEWVAFAPSLINENELIPYDGSEAFTFRPGSGLWFLSKNDWVLPPKTVLTVPLTRESTYVIPLHEGWNIISNPLDRDIPWQSIAASNNISQGIWRWDHGYELINTFFSTANVQEAYYYNNVENLESLKVPYPASVNLSKVSDRPSAPNQASSIHLTASAGPLKNATITFSLSNEGSMGFDKYDLFAPPVHFDTFDLTIHPDHPDFRGHQLARESRPSNEDVYRFDLSLEAEQGERIELQFEGIEGIQQEDIMLVNRLDTRSYNLRETEHIQLLHQAKTTPFTLFIGDHIDVEQAIDNLAPSIISLHQNYPNPFNPQTTIEFALPAPQYVDLSVYDVMGRHIITLYQGEQEAGLHRVTWSGHDRHYNRVANGVYFYRLQADSWTKSHKMTLIR